MLLVIFIYIYKDKKLNLALDKKNLICKILVKENEISFNQNEIEVNLETLAPGITDKKNVF